MATFEVGGAGWSYPRGVAGVRAMIEVGGEHGVSAPTCLAGSGLDPGAVADDATRLRGGQELIVADNLLRATGNPAGLGLDVGHRFRLRMYGVWGFALLTSATLRAAAAVGLRHLELTYATAGIHLEERQREVRLLVDDDRAPPPMRRFVVEREVAAVRAILDTVLGEPFVPLRVDVRFPRPSGSVPYEAVARAPVRFGAERNAIVADAALLDRPLPQADPHTRELCERECRVLARRTEGTAAGRVRDLLMRRRHDLPDMPAAAAALHLSTRTLHRRLAAEGTSFRRVADEVRQVLAIEMLSAGLHVDQVAVRLGYSDAAAFIRAFRRWTGATPGAYRDASSS